MSGEASSVYPVYIQKCMFHTLLVVRTEITLYLYGSAQGHSLILLIKHYTNDRMLYHLLIWLMFVLTGSMSQ